MEVAEGAVEGELSLGEDGELGVIGLAFGFGDEGAEVAELRRDGAFFDFLNCALDFDGLGKLCLRKKRFGEKSALGGVFDDVHWVAGLAIGECDEGWRGAERLKESGLLENGLRREAAGVFAVGVGDGEGTQENALDFSEGGGARLDVVAALEGGLAKLFAKHG